MVGGANGGGEGGHDGPLGIEVRADGAACAVTLRGELDMAGVARLREELVSWVDGADDRPPRVVVDCHDLTFADSSGLQAILEARQAVLRKGGTLQLVHVHGAVLRTLEVTHLAPLLVADDDPGTPSPGPA